MKRLTAAATIMVCIGGLAWGETSRVPGKLDIPNFELRVVGTLGGHFDKDAKIYMFYMVRNDGTVRHCQTQPDEIPDVDEGVSGYVCTVWAQPLIVEIPPPN